MPILYKHTRLDQRHGTETTEMLLYQHWHCKQLQRGEFGHLLLYLLDHWLAFHSRRLKCPSSGSTCINKDGGWQAFMQLYFLRWLSPKQWCCSSNSPGGIQRPNSGGKVNSSVALQLGVGGWLNTTASGFSRNDLSLTIDSDKKSSLIHLLQYF